jgi:hypothetical protein
MVARGGSMGAAEYSIGIVRSGTPFRIKPSFATASSQVFTRVSAINREVFSQISTSNRVDNGPGAPTEAHAF